MKLLLIPRQTRECTSNRVSRVELVHRVTGNMRERTEWQCKRFVRL